MALDYLLEALKHRGYKAATALPGLGSVDKLPQPGTEPHDSRPAMTDPTKPGKLRQKDKQERGKI